MSRTLFIERVPVHRTQDVARLRRPRTPIPAVRKMRMNEPRTMWHLEFAVTPHTRADVRRDENE